MRLRCALVLVLTLAGSVPAAAEAAPTAFRCDGRGGIGAMENEYAELTTKGACWFHLGHHTYDMGGPFRIGQVEGAVFSVEVQFSPPTELMMSQAALAFESSIDGLDWNTVTHLPYNLRLQRQQIDFSFDAGGIVARFLRIRQPRSAAQGLSGYLDSSRFDADLTPMPSPLSSPAAPGTIELSCAEDVMERFFDEHPCWFGGANRYDSPSVFHTYPISIASVSRIEGTATFLPWRTDDYTSGGGSRTVLTGYVQVSTDSRHWVTVLTMTGEYGRSIAFAAELGAPVEASFVRVVAEYSHAVKQHPALKHVRGMLLDSSLRVTTV